ncbi:PREDICTED: serine/threonine-protein phosphatase 7 long form homolog [Lupinus angustifolius]|uniref:serine/threonine-protein phosphatase 7 long form homolog n=1 Tax=Lupinus angustifolius TaxID=3871 RepID=UPI00092E779B|nr:PREDICTED: serine/threonine-protein phosphatase 7 long form homolog [Lupinus angustifolius]
MEHIGPGPINPSLLNLQKDHVSTNIWNGREVTFRARYNFRQQLPSAPVLEVIRNTTFGYILDICTIEINNHLITTLVERWRPETHTFHLPVGECTVTIEYVAYQLGLPINGAHVTSITSGNWEMICHNLLGAIPTDKQIMGQRIQMSWLDSAFVVLPQDVDDVVIEQQARAFILRMIGVFLMLDTSGSRVHLMYLPLLEDLSQTYQYSWGSVVLACLHRGICRAAIISHQIEIEGCLHLLQSWAYDRIPMLAPRVGATSNHQITTNIPGHATNIIRSMLDRLRIDQFVWTPYRNITYVGPIPDVARARVPLICFALVEWHAADRVMRQFGLQQPIPEDPINLEKQHKMDLRGKNDYN